MNASHAGGLSDLGGRRERRRLLVVDDVEESRTATAGYFLSQGYEVSVATSGVEALARCLARGGVDVVIMNVTLPGLEGYEAAAILRKINPQVQVLLTMEADAEARPHENRRAERFRCFPKPLDLGEIARAIEQPAPSSASDAERNTEDAG